MLAIRLSSDQLETIRVALAEKLVSSIENYHASSFSEEQKAFLETEIIKVYAAIKALMPNDEHIIDASQIISRVINSH